MKYLYRAVHSTGQTIDFLLTAQRDATAAKRFSHRVFESASHPAPRVINVDRNAPYPVAVKELKEGATKANATTTMPLLK